MKFALALFFALGVFPVFADEDVDEASCTFVIREADTPITFSWEQYYPSGLRVDGHNDMVGQPRVSSYQPASVVQRRVRLSGCFRAKDQTRCVRKITRKIQRIFAKRDFKDAFEQRYRLGEVQLCMSFRASEIECSDLESVL